MFALSAMPIEARTLAAVEADGLLRVGLTGDYAPYSLRGPDGDITGADVRMAQALAKKLGVRLEIVPTTWESMTADFKAGRFDIAMGGVSVTAERAAIGDFSVTVMPTLWSPMAQRSTTRRVAIRACFVRPPYRAPSTTSTKPIG
jgi:cyclohexadienyl dehydratase